MINNLDKIKVIGFDADDTLWVNESYYRETEEKFGDLMHDYCPFEETSVRLLEVEINNMELYGYGTKAFVLSLIETAIKISEGRIEADIIRKIIDLGKKQLSRVNEILPGVPETLKLLSGQYRLIVATKGDLLDQERKLSNSGLLGYFHHIEIMSDKKPENYLRLLSHLDIQPCEFVMVGNSVKSDILPVLEIGGNAVHIPFHTTWIHEEVSKDSVIFKQFTECESITELPEIFS
jgi:putative hydrolase of the HAD superfamily